MRDKLINTISISSLIYAIMHILYNRFIHSIPLWRSLIEPGNIFSLLPYIVIGISAVIQLVKSNVEGKTHNCLMYLVAVAVILAGVTIVVHFRLYDYSEMTWKQFGFILILFALFTIIGAGISEDYWDSFFPSILVCILFLGLISGCYEASLYATEGYIENFLQWIVCSMGYAIFESFILVYYLIIFVALIPFKLFGVVK